MYKERPVLVVNKRHVTQKFKPCTQLWQIFISAEMWPIKEREKGQTGPHKVAKKLEPCVVTVLFLILTPLIVQGEI